MRNLGTLYRFELKKIFQKKLVWITFAVMLLAVVLSASGEVLGSYYVDGVKVDTHYHMMKTDRAYERALNKRAVDQKLLAEMQAGYAKIPEDADRYSITQEYQTYARPYSAVFNFVRQASGMAMEEVRIWQPDEEEFYRLREEALEEEREYWQLTEAEKDFWRKEESKLQLPFVFFYAGGYSKLADVSYTANLAALLLVGICLAGVFTDEHTRRTDQLLLAGKLGKKELYRAKMLAGMSFGAACALILSAAVWICCLGIYGADGFHAAVQFIFSGYSGKLSAGGAALILYGLLIVASVMVSAFVMMLSELLHSNIGTLAVLFGILLVPMFVNIPAQYRTVSQIFCYLPGELVNLWNTFDMRLVKVSGIFLTAWQAAPLLYLVLTAAFCLIAGRAYRRYQVGGR